MAAYFWLGSRLSADIELAYTRSRFTEDEDEDGEGDRVDGSLPFVGSAGLGWKISDRWQTNLRLRHFGRRTLDSFANVKSEDFTVVNMSIVYAIAPWRFKLDVLNLFDSRDHDIDYLYASRLNGEPEGGVEDVHFHPIEPRTTRLSATYTF